MSDAIVTVGIYLSEDERRLLTSLASDLECREGAARSCSEGPEAKTYAATAEALRKLMHLPATRAVSVERVREVVRETMMCTSRVDYNGFDGYIREVSDRVVAELGSIGLTAEERTLVEWMRSLFTANPLKHQQHDPVAKQHTDNCVAAASLLNRLFGAAP